jgi:hypothetical protein
VRRHRAFLATVLLLAAGGISYVATTAPQSRALANDICVDVGPITVSSQTVQHIGACVPTP